MQKVSGVRLPPQDTGAEQALLGCIMLKPENFDDVLASIRPEDFYAEKHKRIFTAMVNLREKSEPIDVVSVTTVLKSSGQIDSVGGASYVTELVNGVPSAANLEYYAGIVQKKSSLRKLIRSAEHISELGYHETEDIDTVFDKAEQAILNLGHFTRQAFVRLKDTLVEAWERFDHLHKTSSELRGIPTGFTELDHKLAGLQKSDLIILAARPSMGKTSLALDIARQAACQHNKSVGIFSLEMSSQQLVDRLIASESRVDSWKLRTGKVSVDSDFGRIRDALDRLATAPIFIDDTPGNTVSKMRAVARRLKAEHGLDMIIVDYLQLMIPQRESDSLVQQVTEISRSLKGLAREMEVPVLALSQLNRAVEQRGGKPRLSDLRDSGSIEQDADVVLFIHRDDKYNEESNRKNIADLIIAKHRNGPTGEVQLYFDEGRVSFTNLEKAENFGGF
jgi:replicative DNA helicase